jgi:predicted AAA+ superfamily ATPase
LDADLRYRVYKEYLDVMIFRDLIQRYEIKNDKALYYFIKRMLSNVAKEFSVNKIFNELKSN